MSGSPWLLAGAVVWVLILVGIAVASEHSGRGSGRGGEDEEARIERVIAELMRESIPLYGDHPTWGMEDYRRCAVRIIAACSGGLAGEGRKQ